MGFLKELFKLTRFEHAIMLALAVFIGECVVLRRLPYIFDPIIILSLIVPMLSEMGSFALNDYLDIEADRANGMKERPLVKGTISPAFALRFSIVCLCLSIAASAFINLFAFAIALLFNLLAIAYNMKLKDLPLVGNIYIGLTMAIPFVFGNFVVSGELSNIAVVLALLGFVAGLAREIIKSAQDMEGDRKARGSKTLPILIGEKNSVIVAALLYIVFMPLSVLPFFLGLAMGYLPVFFVGVGDCLIVLIVFRLLSQAQNRYRYARNMSLLAFAAGMLGLLLAAI